MVVDEGEKAGESFPRVGPFRISACVRDEPVPTSFNLEVRRFSSRLHDCPALGLARVWGMNQSPSSKASLSNIGLVGYILGFKMITGI